MENSCSTCSRSSSADWLSLRPTRTPCTNSVEDLRLFVLGLGYINAQFCTERLDLVGCRKDIPVRIPTAFDLTNTNCEQQTRKRLASRVIRARECGEAFGGRQRQNFGAKKFPPHRGNRASSTHVRVEREEFRHSMTTRVNHRDQYHHIAFLHSLLDRDIFSPSRIHYAVQYALPSANPSTTSFLRWMMRNRCEPTPSLGDFFTSIYNLSRSCLVGRSLQH